MKILKNQSYDCPLIRRPHFCFLFHLPDDRIAMNHQILSDPSFNGQNYFVHVC